MPAQTSKHPRSGIYRGSLPTSISKIQANVMEKSKAIFIRVFRGDKRAILQIRLVYISFATAFADSMGRVTSC